MKRSISLALLCACALSAETNFSGVWKVDLEKSKLAGGPKPTNILIIVEQTGPKVVETIGTYDQRGGERRSTFTFDSSAPKPSVNSERGLPMRTKVSWEGATLVLDSQIAGGRAPTKRHETWSLEGNTITIAGKTTMANQDMATTMILEKQPDSAGDALRKPEQTAGQRFKNVKILKDIPASQFLDAMGSFNMSLGKRCEFCHVEGKMDSDEKKEKVTARKMIEMTHHINEQNFEGKMEVRCYTCHKGLNDPQGRPPFVD